MKAGSRLRQALLGLLVGLLLTGGTPAAAQWTVFDPTNYALQTAWKIEEASRWIERVQQHIETYQMLINQWLTLKDVLTNAEKLVNHNHEWAMTMAGIGASVRGIFKIKDQIESLVRLKITALKNIGGRLKRGIFDPDADLADLEEYLKHGIGRTSWAYLANLERLANFDNTLETLYERWQAACAKKAALMKELERLRELHDQAVAKGKSPDSIHSLEIQIKQVEQQINDINKLIDELWTVLVERARRYHARIVVRERAGMEIVAVEGAWEQVFDYKEDAMRRLEEYDAQARLNREGVQQPPADPGPIFPGGRQLE